MMRKLDEPLLSLELFDECQNLTSKKENICLEIKSFFFVVASS